MDKGVEYVSGDIAIELYRKRYMLEKLFIGKKYGIEEVKHFCKKTLDDLKESVLQMIRDVVSVESYNRLSGETSGDWDVEGLQERFKELYDIDIDGEALRNLTVEGSIEDIYSQLIRIYEDKEKSLSSELLRRLEKYILLEVTDSRWRENLRTLDQLKEGIHLRAYGQSNPLVQYQLLSSEVYEDMLKTIREEVTSFLFKIRKIGRAHV